MAPGTLYDPSTAPQLRPWLIRTLEPMYAQVLVFVAHSDLSYRCDADPVVLADYVLALLIHDGPEAELRKMFAKQLEEFLEGGASLTFFAVPISSHFNYISCRSWTICRDFIFRSAFKSISPVLGFLLHLSRRRRHSHSIRRHCPS